jgi:predicted PurR-regulated permease PerM
LVLALVVALAELIPIFGPILSGVVAVAVAASSGGLFLGLPTAVWVAGGFIILHQLENHLLYPLVVKKVVGVAPLLVILALVAGVQLAGLLGILLSVPIAAAIQEFVSDILKRKERELHSLKS